jgi:hypothetical protein
MTKSLQYRTLFYDKKIEEEFSDNGFAIVTNKVDISKINDLKSYFNNIFKNIKLREGFSTGFDYFDIDTRFKNHDFILKTIHNLVEEICIDCEVYLSNYIIKTNERNYNIDVHQDWSYVDETQHRSFNIWIPLQDTTIQNGAMVLLPKTHYKYIETYRTPSIPFYFDKYKNILYNYIQPIELNKGDILIFDNSLIHGATSNNHIENRIAVVLCVKPKESKLQFLFPDNDNLLVYEQENDFIFYFDNYLKEIKEKPKLGKLIKHLPKEYIKIDNKSTLISILNSIEAKKNNKLFIKYKNNKNIFNKFLLFFTKNK